MRQIRALAHPNQLRVGKILADNGGLSADVIRERMPHLGLKSLHHLISRMEKARLVDIYKTGRLSRGGWEMWKGAFVQPTDRLLWLMDALFSETATP